MKPCHARQELVACGPERLFACVRLRGLRASKAAAGRRAALRLRRPTRLSASRLPCAARRHGPVAQLAARASLAALRQARRVRARSALRARAMPAALLGAAIRCARRPATALQSTVASLVRAGPPANTRRRCWAKGRAGRPRSEFWRRGAQASRPARVSAPRELTRGTCPSAAPAGRAASCAAGREAEHRRGVGPRQRADRQNLSAAACPPGPLPAQTSVAVTASRPPSTTRRSGRRPCRSAARRRSSRAASAPGRRRPARRRHARPRPRCPR